MIVMEKKKGQGTYLRLTKQETSYMLFRRKKCRNCGGKMKRHKAFVGMKLHKDLKMQGFTADGNFSLSDPNQEMRVYTYHYTCLTCNSTFSISELASN